MTLFRHTPPQVDTIQRPSFVISQMRILAFLFWNEKVLLRFEQSISCNRCHHLKIIMHRHVRFKSPSAHQDMHTFLSTHPDVKQTNMLFNLPQSCSSDLYRS